MRWLRWAMLRLMTSSATAPRVAAPSPEVNSGWAPGLSHENGLGPGTMIAAAAGRAGEASDALSTLLGASPAKPLGGPPASWPSRRAGRRDRRAAPASI